MEKQETDVIKEFTNNISAGGLMFETDRSILIQGVFILEIYQPLRESGEEIISISTLAKVKWVNRIDFADRHEGLNKYRIGVEFVKVDDGEKKRIAEYIQGKLNT